VGAVLVVVSEVLVLMVVLFVIVADFSMVVVAEVGAYSPEVAVLVEALVEALVGVLEVAVQS
jgi:hypothetical protein